jgi:hypothetical protein
VGSLGARRVVGPDRALGELGDGAGEVGEGREGEGGEELEGLGSDKGRAWNGGRRKRGGHRGLA